MWNEQGAKSAVSESVAGGESPGDNAACGAKGRSPPAHEVYNTAARVGATAVGAKGSVREQHEAEAIEDPHLYTWCTVTLDRDHVPRGHMNQIV